MKKTLLVAAMALAIFACQNDAPADKNDQQSDATENGTPAVSQRDARVAELGSMDLSDIAKSCEQVAKGYDEVNKKMLGLMDQVSNIPEAVKNNVADFPELSARLEGYAEKSGVASDELNNMAKDIAGLQGGGNSVAESTGGEAGAVGNLTTVADYEESLEYIKKEVKFLEEAVAKLKKAPNQGKGLVLFGEGSGLK